MLIEKLEVRSFDFKVTLYILTFRSNLLLFNLKFHTNFNTQHLSCSLQHNYQLFLEYVKSRWKLRIHKYVSCTFSCLKYTWVRFKKTSCDNFSNLALKQVTYFNLFLTLLHKPRVITEITVLLSSGIYWG